MATFRMRLPWHSADLPFSGVGPSGMTMTFLDRWPNILGLLKKSNDG